jgi:hypothetical protein
MNKMHGYRDAFHGLTPRSGYVPKGFLADFLGILTDVKFRTMSGLDRAAVGGANVVTNLLGDGSNGEGWFEGGQLDGCGARGAGPLRDDNPGRPLWGAGHRGPPHAAAHQSAAQHPRCRRGRAGKLRADIGAHARPALTGSFQWRSAIPTNPSCWAPNN